MLFSTVTLDERHTQCLTNAPFDGAILENFTFLRLYKCVIYANLKIEESWENVGINVG